jgi:hypothetical protein
MILCKIHHTCTYCTEVYIVTPLCSVNPKVDEVQIADRVWLQCGVLQVSDSPLGPCGRSFHLVIVYFSISLELISSTSNFIHCYEFIKFYASPA